MKKSASIFHEEQTLPLAHARVTVIIPPLALTVLCIWQIWSGHQWGKLPLSKGSVVFWTIFLWIIYFRLLRVRLVTDVNAEGLTVGLRGLWRTYHVPWGQIKSLEVISFNAAADFGGYGIRTTRSGKVYVAASGSGVRIELENAPVLIVGSERAHELASVLSTHLKGSLSKR